ncbi:hypothetical protein [Vreelandella stevensii]|uniref:hypothetical protein n=1 Tax=Halomonadaceae TaxID=28256 RepID=UPI0012E9F6BA|nr:MULTISPECIES: hypothetical protein [Halomonas]
MTFPAPCLTVRAVASHWPRRTGRGINNKINVPWPRTAKALTLSEPGMYERAASMRGLS